MQKLKYGMPTLIETSGIDECALICHDLNLDFIELSMDLPEYQPMNIDIGHYLKLSEKYSFGYTIHLSAMLNVSDFNPYLAEASLRTMLESIEIAKKLSVPVLNMHMAKGDYFTLPDRRVNLYDKYRDFYVDSIIKMRDTCEKAIGDSEIVICVENCRGFTDFQKAALEVMLESDVFGLTLDIGHSCGTDFADEPFILSHAGKLKHMHIHDAIGKKNHLPLGAGELDIKKYLKLRSDHNCTMVLETKTIDGLKTSVDWIKNQ